MAGTAVSEDVRKMRRVPKLACSGSSFSCRGACLLLSVCRALICNVKWPGENLHRQNAQRRRFRQADAVKQLLNFVLVELRTRQRPERRAMLRILLETPHSVAQALARQQAG